jgi:type II secretory pathway pseudopilin PulG
MKKWRKEKICKQSGLVLSSLKGFTLIEALIVMSIFIILAGLTTINLLNAKHQSSLSTSIDTFISDIKQQQLKAMIGDTEGRTTSDNYGIYFGATSYTLFHGTYSTSEPTNFSIPLGDNIQFTNVKFPGSEIIFLRGSGEINSYDSNSSTITLKDILNNSEKTITLNRYGVVTNIN